MPPPEARPPDAQRQAPPGSRLHHKLNRWPTGIPGETLRAIRADYADRLALLDAQFAGLLEQLSQRDDCDRVGVTVISDHGELLGDWGLLLKGCFLEGAVRSLCMHRPPGGLKSPMHAGETTPVPLTEAVWRIARMTRSGSDARMLMKPWGPCESELGRERVRFMAP
jgi:arylsulfatase A-like enzyme